MASPTSSPVISPSSWMADPSSRATSSQGGSGAHFKFYQQSPGLAQIRQALPEMLVVAGLGDDLAGHPETAAQGLGHDFLLQGLDALAGLGGDFYKGPGA